jgi:hypothetical protein
MMIKSDTDGGPNLVTEWEFLSSDAIKGFCSGALCVIATGEKPQGAT